MSMETIRTAKIENLPELIVNRRVGGTDMITAVRKALLADIFVLMTKSFLSFILELLVHQTKRKIITTKKAITIK